MITQQLIGLKFQKRTYGPQHKLKIRTRSITFFCSYEILILFYRKKKFKNTLALVYVMQPEEQFRTEIPNCNCIHKWICSLSKQVNFIRHMMTQQLIGLKFQKRTYGPQHKMKIWWACFITFLCSCEVLILFRKQE